MSLSSSREKPNEELMMFVLDKAELLKHINPSDAAMFWPVKHAPEIAL